MTKNVKFVIITLYVEKIKTKKKSIKSLKHLQKLLKYYKQVKINNRAVIYCKALKLSEFKKQNIIKIKIIKLKIALTSKTLLLLLNNNFILFEKIKKIN